MQALETKNAHPLNLVTFGEFFLSSFCYMVPIIYTFKHILANAQNQERIYKTIAYPNSILLYITVIHFIVLSRILMNSFSIY